MRTINLSDLGFPNYFDVERVFYAKMYSNIVNLLNNNNNSVLKEKPNKKYEILKVNLENEQIYAIMLTDNLPDGTNKELYYDINNAFEVYKRLVCINENLRAESHEKNELYLYENITKSNEINDIIMNDNALFQQAVNSYGG